MAIEVPITQEYLRSIVHCDPDSGTITWKERPLWHFKDARIWKMWNTRCAGKRAGTTFKGRHDKIHIDGKFYHTHQIIFLYMSGYVPDMIDHIDNNCNNNKWSNLREATYSQNVANSGRRSHNTSGHKGVTWNKERKKWEARIYRQRKRLWSKRFDNFDEAVAEFRAKFIEIHGEFARFE